MKRKTWWQKLKCRFNFHSWKTIGSGYPQFQRKWVKLEHCSHCRSWRRVTDDIFAPERDERKYPLDKDYFVLEDTCRTQVNQYIASVKKKGRKSPMKK